MVVGPASIVVRRKDQNLWMLRMVEKLTAPQLRALAAIAEGRVRRTWSSGTFEKVEGQFKPRRLNDTMIEKLKRLGLIELAPRDGYSFDARLYLLTEAGSKCMNSEEE